MIETLGLEEIPLPQLLLYAGLALGVLFGALAQSTRFCLRRAIASPGAEGRAAGGVWLIALAGAILAVQLALHFELLDLSDHRFRNASPALGGLALGGLLFGAGMILTRGCASRLTVLAASGNLRAALVMLVFAAVAYATLRGVLSPLNSWAGGFGVVEGGGGGLAAKIGLDPLWLGLAAAAALTVLALRSGARPVPLALGLAIGLVIAGGWLATGFVLVDEFDPRPAESLAFTSTASDTLFYVMASTALEPGFGLGLILGTLAGAHLSARLRGELRLESFETPQQTLRYLAGAVLMGVGGVLAGGCTIGAGLSGVSTLSIAPIVALAGIVLGGLAANSLTARHPARAVLTPAE